MNNFPWAITGLLAIFLALLVAIGWFVYRDDQLQKECWASGGIVAQAQHGEGWSCVRP